MHEYLVAGPCAAESREQVLTTASQLAAVGIRIFRAGVWKPRTQPGHFEGVGEPALGWLREAADTYGLEVATEVANREQTLLALQYGIRTLWLGARTTTSPFLVQEIADAIASFMCTASDAQPAVRVMVKNPLSPDCSLWLGAIQRMEQAVGEGRVMAVHRGFQNGQPSGYRNAPVWSIAFELRRLKPHIPLLLDASHMAGKRSLIAELCCKAMELGYDGLMLESHCAPDQALTDKEQQLSPAELEALVGSLPKREGASDMGLSELRSRIDETDDTLWALIAQRMQISGRIGEYKREHGIPVLQSARFAEIADRRIRWARENGLSEECVRAILNALHEESCKHQI